MSSGSRRTLSPRVASAETMISPRFKRLLSDNVTTSDGRVMPTTALLHLDQGISVTSHASQGKTVDNVIVSAPEAAFAQVSQAQLYVSMSRARRSMHLMTDCKEELRNARKRGVSVNTLSAELKAAGIAISSGALAKYLSRRSSSFPRSEPRLLQSLTMWLKPHGQVKMGTKEPEHRESGTGPK